MVIASLPLAGCLVESKHPVTPPDPKLTDAGLFGVWSLINEREPHELVATVQIDVGTEGPLDIQVLGEEGTLHMRGHISKVGPYHFANLRLYDDTLDIAEGTDTSSADSEHAISPYMWENFLLVRYALNADRTQLTLWEFDQGPFWQEAKLSPEHRPFDGVMLNAQPGALEDFLEKAPEAIFRQAAVLNRVD